MALLTLPINNDSPAFTFFANLDGNSYKFSFRYNSRMSLWIFDLYDNEDNPLFLGKPFQTDVDFLRQVVDVTRPPGLLFCANNKEVGVDADRFTIGTDVLFYYLEAV